jgi:hypothetical protein
VNGRVFDQSIGEWRDPTPAETAEARARSTAQHLAAALKERFPWLAGRDEINVSGSDVIDQLSAWYEELASASRVPSTPTLKELLDDE